MTLGALILWSFTAVYAAAPGPQLSLSDPPAPIAAVPVPGIRSCDTLFALRVAERQLLPDCDTAISVTGICTGMTANECQAAVHASPQLLAPPAPAAGQLLYSYLPRCVDGSNNCLPVDYIHCIDGTRPMLHADPARDAVGKPIVSNKWLFYVSGGGSCFGPDCWDRYRSASSRLEMSTCHPDAVNCWSNNRSHVGERVDGSGILAPGPNNPYNGFNRVRLNKCAYDGFQGDTFEQSLAIDRNFDGKPEQRVLRTYHQGHLVYIAALNYLANGITLAGGAGPQLPVLRDAQTVLLVGNSGGGKAMIMTGDRLREHLEQQILTSPATVIRLVVDAHYLPSLENEAAFETAVGAPLDDLNANNEVDIFDHHFTGIMGQLPDDPDSFPYQEFYSDWTYANVRGRVRNTAVAFMGTDLSALDASCLATHPGERSFCLDEIHVLLNHVSTPFFLRMDLRDNAWIDGSALFGGEFGTGYDWPDQAFIDRVDLQTRNYLDFHRMESEIARNEDTSGDATCLSVNDVKPDCWSIAVWAPSAGGPCSHTGLLDPFHFGTVPMPVRLSLCEDNGAGLTETQYTMASALQAWLANGMTFEARPFYDAGGTTATRYWIDPLNATCSTELNCSNGIDDDGDGDIDSADSDCGP